MMCSSTALIRRSCFAISRRLYYQAPLVLTAVRAFSAEAPARDSSFDVFAKIKDKGDGKMDASPGEAKKRKPSDKVIKLVDDILSLSLIEAADLCDLCQEKLAARSGGVPGRSPFPHPGAMFGGGGMIPSPMMMGTPMPGGAPQQPTSPPAGEATAAEGGGEAEEKPAEKKKEPAKSVVTIKLVSYNTEKKVTTIKEVRAVTGLGLREAKDAVEGCPTVIKKGVPLEHAEEIKKKMESTGAQESFDNDRVFGDSDEVRLEAYPTGERDSHRKRFDSFESWDSASSSCSSRDDDSNDEMELDENGLIFMSFEASHEFREMRATREVQHYGRVRVFKGPLGVVLYIGPHWYAIIVMVGVIIGIGFGFAWMLTPRLEVSENQRKVQGLVGTILTGSFKVESDSPKPDYG
ncbi:hypothetical protein FOL46_000567 [Perkinsus olseni]|uniref:Large ribosomal subunit protein bL12 C-terminal domain-containing protein n=1 Tax=Perkinsus olseni TaxID=32597 RepID=A0A7J6MHH3_PEROL|nr:hypothetical protein FOL46_000567 [Perkinsus olseni]